MAEAICWKALLFPHSNDHQHELYILAASSRTGSEEWFVLLQSVATLMRMSVELLEAEVRARREQSYLIDEDSGGLLSSAGAISSKKDRPMKVSVLSFTAVTNFWLSLQEWKGAGGALERLRREGAPGDRGSGGLHEEESLVRRRGSELTMLCVNQSCVK